MAKEKKTKDEAWQIAKELIKTVEEMNRAPPIGNDMERLCYHYIVTFKLASEVTGGIKPVQECYQERELSTPDLVKQAEKAVVRAAVEFEEARQKLAQIAEDAKYLSVKKNRSKVILRS